jgi:hypothetical protein
VGTPVDVDDLPGDVARALGREEVRPAERDALAGSLAKLERSLTG